MTLGERVESYSGTVADKSLLTSFLTAGLRQVLDLVPSEGLMRHARGVAFTPAVGLSLAEHRVVSVTRSGRGAKRVGIERLTQAQDPSSLYYVTADDPVYYYQDEKVRGLPLTGTWKAFSVPYQDVSYGEVHVENFPVEYEDLVVMYAAMMALSAQIEAVRAAEYTRLSTLLDTEEDIEAATAKMNEIQVKTAALTQQLAALREAYVLGLRTHFGFGEKKDGG